MTHLRIKPQLRKSPCRRLFVGLLSVLLCWSFSAWAYDQPIPVYRRQVPKSQNAADIYVQLDDNRFLVGRFDDNGEFQRYLFFDGEKRFDGIPLNSELSIPSLDTPCPDCWAQKPMSPAKVPFEINQLVLDAYKDPGDHSVDLALPVVPPEMESAFAQPRESAKDSLQQKPAPKKPALKDRSQEVTSKQQDKPPDPNQGKGQDQSSSSTQDTKGMGGESAAPSSSLSDESLRQGVAESAFYAGIGSFAGAVQQGAVDEYLAAEDRNRDIIEAKEAETAALIQSFVDQAKQNRGLYKLENYLQAPSEVAPLPEAVRLGNYEFRSADQGYVARAKEVQKSLRETPCSYAHSKDAQTMGFVALQVSDEYDLLGDVETREKLLELAKGLADLMVGLDPFSGFARSALELGTGKNLITGEPLSNFEKGMAAFGIVTLGFGGSVKALGKVGIKLSKISALGFFKVLSEFPGGKAIGSLEKFTELINEGRKYMIGVGAKTVRQATAAATVGRNLLKKTGKVSVEKARLAVDWVADRKVNMGLDEAVDLADRIVDSAGSLTKVDVDVIKRASKQAPELIDDVVKNSPADLKKYARLVDESAEVRIDKPFGKPATQQMTKKALDARASINSGKRKVYRIGNYGQTRTNPARADFNHSPTEWSLENPMTTKNYADKYGIYSEGTDFVEVAEISENAKFVTKAAPGGEIITATGEIIKTKGGGIEVVVEQGGVKNVQHVNTPGKASPKDLEDYYDKN